MEDRLESYTVISSPRVTKHERRYSQGRPVKIRAKIFVSTYWLAESPIALHSYPHAEQTKAAWVDRPSPAADGLHYDSSG